MAHAIELLERANLLLKEAAEKDEKNILKIQFLENEILKRTTENFHLKKCLARRADTVIDPPGGKAVKDSDKDHPHAESMEPSGGEDSDRDKPKAWTNNGKSRDAPDAMENSASILVERFALADILKKDFDNLSKSFDEELFNDSYILNYSIR